MQGHRIVAAAALCAILALPGLGCFRIGVTVGEEIPAGHVARIVPGVTTKEEILQWFGAPAEATDGEIFARIFDAGEISAEDLVALPFADLLVYEITDGRARILFTFVFNWAEVKLKRDRLMVFFDDDDVVLYFGVTRQRDSEAAEDADERTDAAEEEEDGARDTGGSEDTEAGDDSAA